MRTYTLFWKDGKREEIHGSDLDHACTGAQLTRKQLENVAFYLEGNCNSYLFDEESRVWKLKK